MAYAGPEYAQYETGARELFASFARKIGGSRSSVMLDHARSLAGLEARPQMWKSDGSPNPEHGRPEESDIDELAWALIQEGIRVDLLRQGENETYEQFLTVDAAEARRSEASRHFYVRSPLIRADWELSGSAHDSGYWKTFASNIVSRRPSRELTIAFARYRQRVQGEEARSAQLPLAGVEDLVDYVRSGGVEDPLSWFDNRGSRLGTTTWATLARAFRQAKVPTRGVILRERRGVFGVRRIETVTGWIVDSETRDTWQGRKTQTQRVLRPDGSRLRHDGSIEDSAGSLTSARIQQIIRQQAQ